MNKNYHDALRMTPPDLAGAFAGSPTNRVQDPVAAREFDRTSTERCRHTIRDPNRAANPQAARRTLVRAACRRHAGVEGITEGDAPWDS